MPALSVGYLSAPCRPLILLLAALTFPAAAGGADDAVDPTPLRTITADTELPAGATIRQRIEIRASGITLDGHGATLVGPGEAGRPATFRGAGIVARGVSGVTLRNVRVRGFRRGFDLRDVRGWTIEGCDVSDNYHDPEYGWGDYERVGGLILTGAEDCVIRKSRALRVWNGLDLWDSHRNRIEDNVLSRCSNVCLKLWSSSRNHVARNDLSWGLRIRPGEVHARDSTGVLIESGSNDNRFERNDVTHGGDGIFIRVLNGWVSTGNVFVENDCSWANNNAFEAWSPGNSYYRNRANHSSYGFWLGGSDRTVLVGNEAGFNGQADGFHNAPEPDFRHGGIVIVNGSGSHTRIEGNWCHHNAGGGIVFRGDLATRGAAWKMRHVVVQDNLLEANRWGLFARFTDSLYLAGNRFRGNEEEMLLEEVTRVWRGTTDPFGQPAPLVSLEGPSVVRLDESAVFDAAGSVEAAGRPLELRWVVAGRDLSGPRQEVRFSTPGFHRVQVTGSAGHLAGLASRDVYVVRPSESPLTETRTGQWRVETAGGGRREPGPDRNAAPALRQSDQALVGSRCLALSLRGGRAGRATLHAPLKDGGLDLSRASAIELWVAARARGAGFRGAQPVIGLHAARASWRYTPVDRGRPRNLLGQPRHPEAREGWILLRVPIEGGDGWWRTEVVDGQPPLHHSRSLRFETVGTSFPTGGPTAMASDGRSSWCATADGRLFRSTDGRAWSPARPPRQDLDGAEGGWESGMLAWLPPTDPGSGSGRLVLRRRAARPDAFGDWPQHLVTYDIDRDRWARSGISVALGHGTTVARGVLWGVAHAVLGNFGGPVCRVDWGEESPVEQRTVLEGLRGANPDWFSRSAQLAAVGGAIYGIKNDWKTPRPEGDASGDRLFRFDPERFAASAFRGGRLWDDKRWTARRTPAEDLGPLPFEIGHGASLVGLPPHWSADIGARGGLFITAGCSPSDHEGYGLPSDRFAIHDLASGRTSIGRLPGPTGQATSAVLHRGRLLVQRGGLRLDEVDRQLWIVTPVSPAEAAREAASREASRMSTERIERLTLTVEASGEEGFDLRIDALTAR